MKEKQKARFKTTKKKVSWKYIAGTILGTFALAASFELLTDALLANVTILFGFFILLGVIVIGILFDIIGVAVTSASDVVFHAMAADKISGAKESFTLIKHAEKVSSICNDVVGDVCGIVSGGISAVILTAVNIGGITGESVWVSLVMTGVVSALTVGGKAIGKVFAISYNSSIVYLVGRIIHFFKRFRFAGKKEGK